MIWFVARIAKKKYGFEVFPSDVVQVHYIKMIYQSACLDSIIQYHMGPLLGHNYQNLFNNW